jgi:hypothetical protein
LLNSSGLSRAERWPVLGSTTKVPPGMVCAMSLTVCTENWGRRRRR